MGSVSDIESQLCSQHFRIFSFALYLVYGNHRIAVIQGIWNTIAGGNCILAGPGRETGKYLPQTPPVAVFDNNGATKYLSFGNCGGDLLSTLNSCGLKTGFHFTFVSPPKPLESFRIRTADDFPFRDPLRVTIEGSNATSSGLCLGQDWRLLYDGESGLALKFGRKEWGTTRSLGNNNQIYKSYRFLVTGKRAFSIGVQYADIQFNFGDDQKQLNSSRNRGNGWGLLDAAGRFIGNAFG